MPAICAAVRPAFGQERRDRRGGDRRLHQPLALGEPLLELRLTRKPGIGKYNKRNMARRRRRERVPSDDD